MRKKSAKWQKLKSIDPSGLDFYFITDSSLSKNGIINDVRAAINAGCRIIQYREKNRCTKDMVEDAEKIKELCRSKAVFLVNNRVDIALAVDADGVHLGKEDMPYAAARKMLGNDKIIGMTIHNVSEAEEAQRIGADYIGLSPIFVTSTKKDAGNPCGTAMIKKVRAKIKIPIVAIGGISRENVAQVIKSGADAAAAISAVMGSNNIQKEVSYFIRVIRENKKYKQLG